MSDLQHQPTTIAIVTGCEDGRDWKLLARMILGNSVERWVESAPTGTVNWAREADRIPPPDALTLFSAVESRRS